jgi:hypothetical protein
MSEKCQQETSLTARGSRRRLQLSVGRQPAKDVQGRLKGSRARQPLATGNASQTTCETKVSEIQRDDCAVDQHADERRPVSLEDAVAAQPHQQGKVEPLSCPATAAASSQTLPIRPKTNNWLGGIRTCFLRRSNAQLYEVLFEDPAVLPPDPLMR